MSTDNTVTHIDLTINGEAYEIDPEPGAVLRDVLREELHLTGTKEGCDTGKCGVCTVLLDGDPVKSCLLLAHQAQGAEITTIEGLAADDELHPVQQSFVDNFASQCGFCIPGMIMTSVGLLEDAEDLDRETIRHKLEGNNCRCTGYRKIVDAVEAVATEDTAQEGASD
jgi:aerobic-type carbon monoxide dehydrogenase small subunit (CoxS/CutS family)